jgi:hypothetical protein
MQVRALQGLPPPPAACQQVTPDRGVLRTHNPQPPPPAPALLQALAYGQQLRRRYMQELGLLPEQYTPGPVYAKSTMFTRTVATLRGVLPCAAVPCAAPGAVRRAL